MTFGVIVGNRGFFPDHLARSGRERNVAAFWRAPGVNAIVLDARRVEAWGSRNAPGGRQMRGPVPEASARDRRRHCHASEFRRGAGHCRTLRMADLNVPVLIQATPDSPGIMTIRDRRDSFCGKMSACNNLTQYRIPYSLTTLPHGSARIRMSSVRISSGSSGFAAW